MRRPEYAVACDRTHLASSRIPMTAGAVCSIAGLAMSPAASAHHLMDGATPGSLLEGFVSGLAHPFIGPDHFLYLLTTAMLLAFRPLRHQSPSVMALAIGILAGVLAAVSGLTMPLAEPLCVLTLIGVGAAALSRRDVGPWWTAAMIGSAALFHGMALAGAIVGSEPAPLTAYLLGLSVSAGAVVLGGGLLARTLATGFDADFPRRSRRWTGIAAIAIGNLMLLLRLGGS